MLFLLTIFLATATVRRVSAYEISAAIRVRKTAPRHIEGTTTGFILAKNSSSSLVLRIGLFNDTMVNKQRCHFVLF